jgi:hypothetical protein
MKVSTMLACASSSSSISAGGWSAAAGGDVDDLHQPRGRVIASELQPPALRSGVARERMIGRIDRDLANFHRAQSAAALIKLAVYEQQARAFGGQSSHEGR